MAVKLRSSDVDVVAQLGLPDHVEFSIADPRMHGEKSMSLGSESDAVHDDVRKFEWMKFKQFLKVGGVLSNLSADVCGTSLAEGPDGIEKVSSFLRQGGVDPDSWGNGCDRVLTLLKELQTGKC